MYCTDIDPVVFGDMGKEGNRSPAQSQEYSMRWESGGVTRVSQALSVMQFGLRDRNEQPVS